MKHLLVPALGIGTVSDPFRPDLPDGTAYVGTRDPATGTYLVAVPDAAAIPAKTGRVSLTTAKSKADALTARRLSPAAVALWRIW